MNHRIIRQLSTDKCTGCFACAEICPEKAIHMKLNKEGFYYPGIYEDKCVSCGLCVRICPAKYSTDKANEPKRIYSAYVKDETLREKSSSGGIFGLLANAVLEEGGIVYGAAFDAVNKEVCHTSTDVTPLEDIMRSKYVQSRTGSVYRDAEANLKQGRIVLFSGTPCQIKGLLAYLHKEYHNLITVDFMCHGVPSTGVFKTMINYCEQTEHSAVTDLTFREKDSGWRKQALKVYYADGKVVPINNSDYYYLFLNSYTLRKSCYGCNCYNTHKSDITLSDNWTAVGDDDKGLSLVLINTSAGGRLYDSLLSLTNTEEYRDAFIGYDYFRHDYDIKKHNRFFRYYCTHGSRNALRGFVGKVLRRNKIKCRVSGVKQKIKRLIKRVKSNENHTD